MRTSPEISARLFVGRVAPGTGKAELRRHFKVYGDVADIWLRHDRPFAFVHTTNKVIRRIANEMSKYLCQRVCWIVDKSDEDNKAVHGNISSTRLASETTSARFCGYCQRAVTPGGNCDGLVHTDACLIYQESFVHYPYCVAVADEWFPVGCFIGDVSNAE
uniref:RRM domain-containing protein n=1 Tax=Oryza rufipogon TaxID=4529 RepID=A0A0E0Q3T5_ORYRU